MHTDEYEISLSREIDVCKGRIRSIKKTLRKLEEKYGFTTAFFHEGAGNCPVSEDDAGKWKEGIELLDRWESKKSEFEDLYYKMKK